MLTLFGGASIYVREDINTVSKIISIFGGTANSAPSSRSSHAPVVIVEGLVMFGATKIKIKRTIKEIFVDFADRIRGIQRPSSNKSNKQGKGATPLFKQDRQ
jgi:uridine kinase